MADARVAPERAERRVLAFDSYECDVAAAELRRAGATVRLPQQPLRVLLTLLERPGEVVSRDELRQRLWPADTFVDFEHGLNAAVKRLRAALGDVADRPRYVETVPQRGYRFVAPVAFAPPRARGAHRLGSFHSTIWAVVPLGALLVGIVTLQRGASRGPEVVSALRITHAGRIGLKVPGAGVAPVLTDGARLFYTELDPGGTSRVAQLPVTGGEAVRIATTLARPVVLGLSPDDTELLVRDLSGEGDESPLWALSPATGALRRLGVAAAHDGAWSPDGRQLAYATGREIHLADARGDRAARAATLPGPASWLRWSPDGRTLRFTVTDSDGYSRSLWELLPFGPPARPLLDPVASWSSSCCGEWTPDGRFFLFSASSELRTDVWALTERDVVKRPRKLTSGPVGFLGAVPSRDGRRLFATGFDVRSELMRYDSKRGLLVATSGAASTYSRDRSLIAWVDKARPAALWRSRSDGRDRVQIAPAGMDVLMAPAWSPDASRLAFAGRNGRAPWKIHLATADGARLRELLPGRRSEADPSWSPDGRRLMFGRPPDSLGEPGAEKAIHILDLETQAVTTLPGSLGRFSPRWSPDGHRVAALTLKARALELWSFGTGRWEPLAPGPVHNPLWSADGRFVYFQAEEEEYRPVYRVSLSSQRPSPVVSSADLARACTLVGLDQGDAPLLQCSAGGADLYALDLSTN